MNLKNPKKKIHFSFLQILVFLFLAFFFIVITEVFLIVKPSNNRLWEFGFEKSPDITLEGSNISIENFRNFRYAPGKIVSSTYTKTDVDVNDLERAWFVVEPFEIKPLLPSTGIAHTYFVFDFKNHDPIAISVEARREKNEEYSAWLGLFNKFELIYIWGEELDITGRRALVENQPLFMYPLTISQDASKKLFIQLAKATNDLYKNPRFYNTLMTNCTNELARNANTIKKDAIPFTIALILPGYSAQELYRLGFIPTNAPFEKISQRYQILEFTRKNYSDPNFSQKLRQHLLD
ncbi:MAG: DUF4105 domain-containing protein [Candidatus Levybacteria bacterium]|nr:DUF4105 domain-containing protein [Candidatus Levybacteria bacterium]